MVHTSLLFRASWACVWLCTCSPQPACSTSVGTKCPATLDLLDADHAKLDRVLSSCELSWGWLQKVFFGQKCMKIKSPTAVFNNSPRKGRGIWRERERRGANVSSAHLVHENTSCFGTRVFGRQNSCNSQFFTLVYPKYDFIVYNSLQFRFFCGIMTSPTTAVL